jgi:molybdate transport system substrate-binding protein
MHNKALPMVILILALLQASCGAQLAAAPAAQPAGADPVDLNIFAAASLSAAFEEIGAQFRAAHPQANPVFNFAGSQQLAQQINAGAPADVFASANDTQIKVLIDAGRVVTGTQKTCARNRLVLVYPQDNPAGLAALTDLARPGLKLVFAAAEVPVGQYSLAFLDKAAADLAFGAAYKDGVFANIVSYEDNVKAVLAKVVLGEADAGIVYTSDVTGEDAGKVGQLEIPDALNVIAAYPIAPVNESKNPELAQAFIDLVLSPAGQAILAKYGFIPAALPAGGAP